MRLLTITKKTLIETWRDRQLLAIFLIFPALMILMYFMAFGQTTSMASFITVLIENRDQGPFGAELVQSLKDARFDGQPVFTIRENVSLDEGNIALEEGKAAMLLTIPVDFTTSLQANQSPAKLVMLGDPLTDTYVFARSFLTSAAGSFADTKVGWQKPLPAVLEFLPNTGKMSDFQFGVPGMLVFGVLFCVITSALMLTREMTSGTLLRLRMTGASGLEVLGGVALANLFLALVQGPLAFGTALLCGFSSPGSLVLALAITLILSLAASGLGFLAACFSKSEGAATGIGTALMVPFVFLCGAIFPMPLIPLFSINGHLVQIYDIMPSTHAAEALRRVLVYGDGISSIGYELIMLIFLSVLLLVLGAWLYQRLVLNPSRS